MQVKGVNFEAVLRVEEEEARSKQNLTRQDVEEGLGLSVLIDSQSNQYILAKPRDATIPRADHHLLKVAPPARTLLTASLEFRFLWSEMFSLDF